MIIAVPAEVLASGDYHVKLSGVANANPRISAASIFESTVSRFAPSLEVLRCSFTSGLRQHVA